MKRFSLALVLSLFVCGVANAQATRTWVSGLGNDANPCSRTAPCKTFAGAISHTATGGEIDVLDPGGYGTLTIAKGITVDGGGTMASILASGTTGIIINAPSTDVVVIRNLSINGAGPTLGTNGIRVLNAKQVVIQNVQIANFSNRGIDINPGVGVSAIKVDIKDTRVHNVGNIGIVATSSVAGAITLTMDGVFSHNNAAHGVFVTQANQASITHCTFTQNGGAGVFIDSFGTKVSLSQSALVSNATGVQVGQAGLTGSFCRISKNTISNNTTGVINTSSTIESHQDNAIAGNTTDFSGLVTGIGQQ
jgi:hypothetical protein